MRLLLPLVLLIGTVTTGSAAMINFTTAPGSMVPDGPVSAAASFTTTNGQLTVVLYDLLANPTSAGQLVSDLQFTLSVGGTNHLASSSAQQITIDGSGNPILGPTTATGWGFGTFQSGLILCVICPGGVSFDTNVTAQPSQEIIGPGPYTNANGSIAGNGPHNPFLNQSATFTITNAAITASTTVSMVVFSFGTTPGVNVPGTPAVPEPSSLILMGGGILLLGCRSLKRRFL